MAAGVKPKPARSRVRQRRAAGGGKPALWEGRFSVIDPAAPGGRRWLSVYGATRAEAEGKLAEAMAARGRGVMPPRGSVTVADYLAEWIEQVTPTLRPLTAVRYREMVERHITPRVGHIRLSALKPADVNRMTADIVAGGRRARTANHARAILRAALNDAVKEGRLNRNVASLAEPHRDERPPVDAMRPEDARAILAVFEGQPIGSLVATALWTGLRLGELLALTWDRVDLERRQLAVARSLGRINGRSVISSPKTRLSARTVPIAEPLIDVLLAHRERQQAVRRAAGGDWDSSWGDLLFCSNTGEPLVGTSVSNIYRKILRRAGLPHRRFHDLRHGAATLWLASGVDLKTVSALLGHSTISTTANIYTGVLDTLKTDAAIRMTRLLTGSDQSVSKLTAE